MKWVRKGGDETGLVKNMVLPGVSMDDAGPEIRFQVSGVRGKASVLNT